jgi:hypothetical protein
MYSIATVAGFRGGFMTFDANPRIAADCSRRILSDDGVGVHPLEV